VITSSTVQLLQLNRQALFYKQTQKESIVQFIKQTKACC